MKALGVKWDISHLIRDAVIYVPWFYGLTWIGVAEAWWLAGLVTLYGAAWWEASNHSAKMRWSDREALPDQWDHSNWGDMASSLVGVVLAAVVVHFVA